MGARTLQEFRDNLSGQLTRGTITTTLLDKWVNDSLREVGYAFAFPDLEKTAVFNTVVGQYEYPLVTIAPDYRMMHEEGVWIGQPGTSQGRLVKENRTRWLRNIGDYTDTTTYASPYYYHRFARKLVVRPVPDLATYTLTLHYWKALVKLANVGDVTELQEEWDEIVELGALYRGFRHYREFNRAINVRNDYLGLVRSRAMETDVEEIQQGGLNIASDEDDLRIGDG